MPKVLPRGAFILFFLVLALGVFGQPDFYHHLTISRADSLRGQLRPERTCYDVGYYHLGVSLDIPNRTVYGFSEITYRILRDFRRLQIDLFANMAIDSIVQNGVTLAYERDEDAVFVDFPEGQQTASLVGTIKIYYHGQPKVAKNPPWDGGFSWTQDSDESPWVLVSCEGIGASLWWPNKDHLSDEPDSMDIEIVVPDSLMAVSNGILVSEQKMPDHQKSYHWHVSYPINNYNVTLYAGRYAHFHEYYVAMDGDSLDLDYYVLPEHLAKAKQHFAQVHEMLRIYESYLGKYPFWKDGYALVESPTLGMEHQGAISYGNKYKRGYLGGRILKNMDWDYIIIHESGHEYWGNSVSCNDLAEMWLHEGFTTYMEALYVEKKYDYETAVEYLLSQKKNIRNHAPIVGPKGVHFRPMYSTDQYYKGSWILHSLRNAIDNDSLWFAIFRGFYEAHALSHATTQDFVTYVNAQTGGDYTAFFEQYLNYARPPKLLYRLQQRHGKLWCQYKWEADVKGFDMPVRVGRPGHFMRLHPNTKEWKEINLGKMKTRAFRVDDSGFYVFGERVGW